MPVQSSSYSFARERPVPLLFNYVNSGIEGNAALLSQNDVWAAVQDI